MTTTTDRAAGRTPRAAARCASIARAAGGVLGIALSGFTGFCAGAALIGYHVVGTSAPGRLVAAYVAVLVFAADRYLAVRYPLARWLRPALARVRRLTYRSDRHPRPGDAGQSRQLHEPALLDQRHGQGKS